MRLLAAALLAAVCACEPYVPLVLCHNANCTEPANPDEDDTVESLRASLALRRHDRPMLDGVEMDTFWAGDNDRCLFTHDLPGDGMARVEASVPAVIIADHVKAHASDPGGLTRQGGPFTIHVELKGYVGKTKAEKHSAVQRDAHADCALDVAKELRRGAEAAGKPIEILFSSFEPALLTALVARPGWPKDRKLGASVTLRVAALQGIPPPLDSQSVPLGRYGPEVDMVMAHPHWVRDGAWEAYRSRRWDVCFWMFSGVTESFDAVERYRPKWVTTSEANLFVRWLER